MKLKLSAPIVAVLLSMLIGIFQPDSAEATPMLPDEVRHLIRRAGCEMQADDFLRACFTGAYRDRDECSRQFWHCVVEARRQCMDCYYVGPAQSLIYSSQVPSACTGGFFDSFPEVAELGEPCD